MPPTSRPDFQIKEGSQLPAFQATLLEMVCNEAPTPFNLTDATVEFRMSAEIGQGPLFQSPAVIVNPPGVDGVVRYEWGPTDTQTPGMYYAEWVVTINSNVAVVPTVGYMVVQVIPALDSDVP